MTQTSYHRLAMLFLHGWHWGKGTPPPHARVSVHLPDIVNTTFPGQEGSCGELPGLSSWINLLCPRSLCAQLPGRLLSSHLRSQPFLSLLGACTPIIPSALSSLHLTSNGISPLFYTTLSSNYFSPPNAEQLLGQGLPCPHQSSRLRIHCVRAVGDLGVELGVPKQAGAVLKPCVCRSRVPFFVSTAQLHHGSTQNRTGDFTCWNSWSH